MPYSKSDNFSCALFLYLYDGHHHNRLVHDQNKNHHIDDHDNRENDNHKHDDHDHTIANPPLRPQPLKSQLCLSVNYKDHYNGLYDHLRNSHYYNGCHYNLVRP